MSGTLGFIATEQSSALLIPMTTQVRRLVPTKADKDALGPIIIPDCTISERHTDRMEVTEHPVETGAPISDHAFMLPYEVSLRYGWSNSSPQNAIGANDLALLVGGAVASGAAANSPSGFITGGEGYIKDMYKRLQDLQTHRVLFSITTGKRMYANMVLLELQTESDAANEYSLVVELHCKQIILTSTSSYSAGTDSASQAAPDQTSGTIDRGTQQAATTTAPLVPVTSTPLPPP